MRGKRRNWSRCFDHREDAIVFANLELPPRSTSPGDGGRINDVTLEREVSTSFWMDFGAAKIKRIWKWDGEIREEVAVE
jgi:hypothetical protein